MGYGKSPSHVEIATAGRHFMSATTFVGGALDRNASLARHSAHTLQDRMGIMGEVRLVGGAIVTLLILALVLNEIYAAVNINNSSPYHDIVDDLETTGVAALTLLIVGLLVVAASAIMRVMSASGFGGPPR